MSALRARLRAVVRGEEGFAFVLVVLLTALTSVLAVTLIDLVTSESSRAATSVTTQSAYGAAEAGLDDYISKLTADHLYYVHYVAKGESTRQEPGGTLVSTSPNTASSVSPPAWTFALAWTYPNGKDQWRQLSNGYQYNLKITAPAAGSPGVDVVATGRKAGDTNTQNWRAIETSVKPSSVVDYQMIADADIAYGSAATTSGKIYAGIDSSGVAHNVTHDGTALADIYAEGSYSGSTTLLNGAQRYNSSNIRSIIPAPINFSAFLSAPSDIKRAAQNAGVYIGLDATVDAMRLTFLSNGTFTVQKCTQNGGTVDYVQPTCVNASPSSYTVPSNGAIYVEQDTIVSGQVKGRVTVASANNIVIADNTNPVTPGTDVLGLIASNDMIVAHWCPTNLTWSAATIAQNGAWHSYNNDGSHGTMTFTGSTVTAQGGYMSMFTTRSYNYDPNLQFLQAPWFPSVGTPYKILLFRQVNP